MTNTKTKDISSKISELKRERDEAMQEIKNLKLQLGLFEDGNIICEETLGEIRILEERIGEALKELSSIHRWIDKNHADGFIDSLTYLQNLERVTDSLYDRIDLMEMDAKRFVKERDKAIDKIERQAKRILELEGATNHATGTPLSKALQEVDKLKLEITGWKNKWECAVEMAARAENERDEAVHRCKKLERAMNYSSVGKTLLSKFLEVIEERDEARSIADRFRSLYYTKLGINKSASWFPWEDTK